MTHLSVSALQTYPQCRDLLKRKHYSKTLHKLTSQIKYLASRYLNALPQAHRERIWLSEIPINHLFQSAISQWQPLKIFINVQPYEIQRYCKKLHKLKPQIKYLASRYLNPLPQAQQAHICLSKTPITHLFQSPSSQ
jgi:hypothetical protein